MRTCTAVIERSRYTGLNVGHVPGFPGAHGQGETLDDLSGKFRVVVSMLQDDGAPAAEGEFVGTQIVVVA